MEWLALSAAAPFAGAIGSVWNNQQQIGFAKENQNWQERMSNTAYQRQMRDMEAAGLNPMLAINSARGAATGSPVMPNTSNPLEGIGQGIQAATRMAAIDLPHLANETRIADANSAAKKAEARNIDADTVLKVQTSGRSDEVTNKLLADIAQTKQATSTSSAQEVLTGAQTSKVTQEAALLKAVVPYITRGSNAIQQLIDWGAGGGKLGDAAYNMVERLKAYFTPDIPHAEAARKVLDLIKSVAPSIRGTMQRAAPNTAPWSPESGTQAP